MRLSIFIEDHMINIIIMFLEGEAFRVKTSDGGVTLMVGVKVQTLMVQTVLDSITVSA
jgi:hypothetical protein